MKVFYNESTQTFQTQDSFTSKKINPNTGKRCNLQVKIVLFNEYSWKSCPNESLRLCPIRLTTIS